MWRTIYSGNKTSTYRLLSHWLALLTSLNWNESPAHFLLRIILLLLSFTVICMLPSAHGESSPHSSSGSQLLLSSLLQSHSLHVIFSPSSCSRTSSLFFNSISTSLVSSSLYPHSWKLSFFSFIHFHSFFSSYLAVICVSLFCACHVSSLITVSLHSYLVSRCIYSSCIFSSEDSTTMQQ